MTPGNLVAMAKLIGLQVIAITDHQSTGNCRAAMALSDTIEGPLVVPGLEVESSEEIHLICLFPDPEKAEALEAKVRAAMPDIPNRADIFGEQHYYDEQDEIRGFEERMLLLPCSLGCSEIAQLALNLGGVCMPAHVDRDANSMLLILGTVPEDFPAARLEVSRGTDLAGFRAGHPQLARYHLMTNSDAHRLTDIADPGWPLEIPEFLPGPEGRVSLIQALREELNQ
jgi:hypothetical protein